MRAGITIANSARASKNFFEKLSGVCRTVAEIGKNPVSARRESLAKALEYQSSVPTRSGALWRWPEYQSDYPTSWSSADSLRNQPGESVFARIPEQPTGTHWYSGRFPREEVRQRTRAASTNAEKICREASSTRRANSGCHCTAQRNADAGRHSASTSPSGETAMTSSPGASSRTA